MTSKDRLESAISAIRRELRDRLDVLNGEGKLLEAQRLEQRTKYDLEMLVRWDIAMVWRTTPDTCPGVKGTPPECLIDYFPDDWLLIVDESHVTCSQLQAMYNGDQARKKVLIEHDFVCPVLPIIGRLRAVSLGQSTSDGFYQLLRRLGVGGEVGQVVEQVIRPTGCWIRWLRYVRLWVRWMICWERFEIGQ